MRRRWGVLALCALGVVLGMALRSTLFAVGRVVFVLVLVAVGVAGVLLVTATPAYSRTTVGVASRVIERPLAEPSTCVVCDDSIDGGTRHLFVREWVLFGVPVVLADAGENDYCAACVDSPEPLPR